MKRSQQIILLLSGALATLPSGCARKQPRVAQPEQVPDTTGVLVEKDDRENNAYDPSRGYYHAPYHAWFPLPWNYFSGGQGYYYGGSWHSTPYQEFRYGAQSRPYNSVGPWRRSLFRDSHESKPGKSLFRSANPSSFSTPNRARPIPSSPHFSSPSVTRGGFGSSAHGASS